jgi:penicillin-binding protein 2
LDQPPFDKSPLNPTPPAGFQPPPDQTLPPDDVDLDIPLEPQNLPVLRDDLKQATGKLAFFQYVTVGVFVFLVAGYWDLQIQNPAQYREAAERNRIKSQPIVAPRGKILDREGRILADNHNTFSALLSRETLKMEHLAAIADGLHLDYNELLARIRRYERRPRYEAIIIKEVLTPDELSFVESHRDPDTFPELELISAHRRLYPREGFAAHMLGYVGEVSDSDLDTAEFAKYNPGDVVGKFGLERQYNDILMGKDGQRLVEVDSRGRERPLTGYGGNFQNAVPGKNITLTIDLDLQAVAELAMDGRRGAVVALDPRTGEILAMVSRPAFDPNQFAMRITSSEWKAYAQDPFNPMLNRAIQAQLAPGSTFKPIVAMAALEAGVIDDSFKVHCAGGASFYGRYFACHKKGGHGSVELHKGITESCDVFFYNVANKMGIDRLAEFAERVGVGHRTGVDLPGEAEGIMPSSAWKMKRSREKWFAGETISVGIGQGAVAMTPIQLAYAISGIVTGGVFNKPHLLKDPGEKFEPAHKYAFNVDNVNKVIYGMYGVVNEGGTGGRARIPGLTVCGKTGSAQIVSHDLLKRRKQKETEKDNGWFVGFAPEESPEIVIAALFENGVHGYYAAPIVRDIIKSYFDKKARLHPEQRPQLAHEPALIKRPETPLAEPADDGPPTESEVPRQ